MATVLIIDDNEDIRFSLAKTVEKHGYAVFTAACGAEGLEVLRSTVIDLIFLDIGLPDSNGIELISPIREISSDVEVVMLTGINDAKTAVDALRAGAVDYISKPFELIEFTSILNRLLQARLRLRQNAIAYGTAGNHGVDAVIGSCPAMKRIKDSILMAADVDAPVLLTGETGTGKELAARAIHESRREHRGVFVKVDCGTLSASLIESELFGYDKGAFTDARQSKPGLVELANGGTLFLDEITNLPIELQPRLLRLIEESTFRRVGGLKDIKVKLRIIAATNLDPRLEIERGTFREDLYFRLNVVPISLPPLRERGQDVLLLADHFLKKLQGELKKEIRGFTPEAASRLLAHGWQGNIRELKNIIEREIIFNQSGWISVHELAGAAVRPVFGTASSPITVKAPVNQP